MGPNNLLTVPNKSLIISKEINCGIVIVLFIISVGVNTVLLNMNLEKQQHCITDRVSLPQGGLHNSYTVGLFTSCLII